MKRLRILSFCLFVAALASPGASAQMPCSDTIAAPSNFPYQGSACQVIPTGTFTAMPFPDAMCTPNCPAYGDPDNNVVSLYGTLGNSENSQSTGNLLAHYNAGLSRAANIHPLCTDGGVPPCHVGSPAIIFLFIGFSNCDIEVCGGNADAWQGQALHLSPPGSPAPRSARTSAARATTPGIKLLTK